MTQPDEVSDEMLMALADGALSAVDAQRMHGRIDTNPDLATRYADFVETRALVKQAFPATPVPNRLITAVLQGQSAQPPAMQRRTPALTAPRWSMALAASVILAVGGFWVGRSSAPQSAESSRLGAITAHLPTGGALRLSNGRAARVLASFQTELGLCRMIAEQTMRHIVCRDVQTGAWHVALSVQGGDPGSFGLASDVAVGLIDQFLAEIGAGPALTEKAERGALQR